jgi:hypothetical protein
MNMRMINELAGPGVEHAGKTQLDAEFGERHLVERAGALGKER